MIWLVSDGLDGERIDAAAARMSGMSRSRIVDLLNEGKVLLDGVTVTRPSTRVRIAQMLEVDTSEPQRIATVRPQLADGLVVVHEDADSVSYTHL